MVTRKKEKVDKTLSEHEVYLHVNVFSNVTPKIQEDKKKRSHSDRGDKVVRY